MKRDSDRSWEEVQVKAKQLEEEIRRSVNRPTSILHTLSKLVMFARDAVDFARYEGRSVNRDAVVKKYIAALDATREFVPLMAERCRRCEAYDAAEKELRELAKASQPEPAWCVGDRAVVGPGVACLAPQGTVGTVQEIFDSGDLLVVFNSFPAISVKPSEVSRLNETARLDADGTAPFRKKS